MPCHPAATTERQTARFPIEYRWPYSLNLPVTSCATDPPGVTTPQRFVIIQTHVMPCRYSQFSKSCTRANYESKYVASLPLSKPSVLHQERCIRLRLSILPRVEGKCAWQACRPLFLKENQFEERVHSAIIRASQPRLHPNL